MGDAWLGLAAAALLGAWALTASSARRSRAAMASLGEALRALAAGDLSRRIAVPPRSSLGDLMGEFNKMAEGIERRHHETTLAREEADLLLEELIGSREHHRATLEEKVRERTADLQKAYEELKKLDELKDSFLSSVSHELRTPLSSIRSFSEILLTYDGDAQTRREFLGIINQESERLTRLINDVLDLSRMESGEMPWNIEAVSLSEICARAVAPLDVLARQKRQRIVVAVPDDLPPVAADRDRLIQVIENLVSNAVKFTGEGGAIRVSARLDAAAGAAAMARVEIDDDGIGIPREEIRNIFERFKQVGDTLTGKPKGTGLGLPISRDIIRHLGGTMWVESAAGRGSRFLFTLPLAGEAVAPPHRGQTRASRRAPPAGPGPSRVVLIGTDPARRGLLRAELRRQGLRVVETPAGEEAIELCRAEPSALIVIDIASPAREGLALLKRLEGVAAGAAAKVLVVSDVVGREEAIAAGASGHLSRPIDPAHFREQVVALMAPGRRWVAVADDDAGTVGVLSELLGLRGYGVLTAYDGEQALRIARNNDLELLILDLNMPRKSGWKVLEELRSEQRTKDLPVIVLTGMEAEMDRTRALALGAVEFLEKGNGLERLTAEIDLLVQRSL